jgi:uncharacterized protein
MLRAAACERKSFVAKLIVLVIIVLVVMFVLKSYLRGIEVKRQAGAPPDAANASNANMANTMVRCAQCGVHVPRGESILSRGKFFCGEEHRLVHFK